VYFVQFGCLTRFCTYRDKKVVGVFVRFSCAASSKTWTMVCDKHDDNDGTTVCETILCLYNSPVSPLWGKIDSLELGVTTFFRVASNGGDRNLDSRWPFTIFTPYFDLNSSVRREREQTTKSQTLV
jgi:hypothetical protein